MINHLVLSSPDNIHKMTVELHILQLPYSNKAQKFRQGSELDLDPQGPFFLAEMS